MTVAPEHRGSGLLLPLFEAGLGAAAERGEVLSTLYPTANGIYRSLGYELVTSYDTIEIATHELAAVRAPLATRTRRATVDDVPAVRALYDAVGGRPERSAHPHRPTFRDHGRRAGRAGDGDQPGGRPPTTRWSATRSGTAAPATTRPPRSWRCTTCWPPVSTATARCGGCSATFASVVGRVRLSTSGDDPARLVLPSSTWRVVDRHPYMLRVSDPAGALTAAGPHVPGLADVAIDLAVVGDRLGRADGSYRLSLGDGPGRCEEVPPGRRRTDLHAAGPRPRLRRRPVVRQPAPPRPAHRARHPRPRARRGTGRPAAARARLLLTKSQNSSPLRHAISCSSNELPSGSQKSAPRTPPPKSWISPTSTPRPTSSIACRDEVLHHQVKTADAAGLSAVDVQTRAEADRATRALGRHLHDADALARLHVDVLRESEPVDVERDRSLDVGHRDRDQLELHLHRRPPGTNGSRDRRTSARGRLLVTTGG